MQAHERAVERGCEAMQVFNQSPRMWRPTRWKPDDVAEFRRADEATARSSRSTIHAVYLINPATKDREMRKKSADSLIHALRMGDEIRADGVVLHPGSTVGEPQDEALPRVGEMVKHALAESEGCRLLLENTAGAGNTLGRSFEELRELIDLAGGDKRHRRLPRLLPHVRLAASTSRRRTSSTDVVDRCAKIVGLRRLQCLHVNDSLTPLGSNRDRHAPPGDGELGPRGLRRLPVRAALREAAGAVRGPGRGRARAREGGRRQDEEAARAGTALAKAPADGVSRG